jgi:uncharacterized protein YutE (UPF0331/DUF86 family)
VKPSELRAKVIVGRADWVDRMLKEIRALPLATYQSFLEDSRNVAAAESCLRRCLEALLDLGRHILAKGFGEAVSEYKEIARGLVQKDVLEKEEGKKLEKMAGYRNRMVHFYQEITEQELYQICCREVSDIETLLERMLKWVKDHPDMVDHSL